MLHDERMLALEATESRAAFVKLSDTGRPAPLLTKEWEK